MKFCLIVCVCVASISVGAQEISVPAEYLGTWASSQIDCKKIGLSTLTITDSDVRRHTTRGHIIAKPTPTSKLMEVLFDRPSGDSTGRDVRHYRLTTDGRKLQELFRGEVVATRSKCPNE
jgi:hypothetical protein